MEMSVAVVGQTMKMKERMTYSNQFLKPIVILGRSDSDGEKGKQRKGEAGVIYAVPY